MILMERKKEYKEIPIPERKVPSIKEYRISSRNEDLVSLSGEGFLVDSQYYRQGVPGSLPDIWLRESAVSVLHKAERLLPDGLRFMVWDGYRPIAVQKRLWDQYRGTLRIEHPEYTEEELDFRTSFFVSKPSNDPDHPSLHNTGGAVDLTLCDADGNCLYMGSAFDDFSGRAWTNHFEPGYEGHETNLAACRNRRILYHAMTRAGFTNLPSEWWHYDYGDKFWSAFKGKPAMYRGILCAPLPGAFPLH